jgi:Tat protein translocase TatB subunit
MFGIGPMELVLILVVALLVLGPKRMPELARTIGKGLGEFRRASNELRESLAIDEIQNELRDGLTRSGPIHKPMKRPDVDDPPAQAGADLPVETRTGATDPGDDASAEPAEDAGAVVDAPRDEETKRADSTLGSVPVGGRTPDGGVPAGDRSTDSSESERG